MKLLVLGGSVFLSRAAAAAALARGHDVTCANRGLTGTVPPGAHVVRFDRSEGFPAGLRDFDAVIDVARHPSRVQAAVEALPEAHWVFVSSISVYADEATPGQTTAAATVEPRFDDVDLKVDPSAYGPMKVACEQLVAEGAGSAALVRPGLIVGPGDPTGRFTYWPVRLGRAAGSPAVLAPGEPGDLVQAIDVRDLGEWLVELAETRTAGTFDATSPALPLAGVLAQLATGCGAEPDWTWVPQDFLRAHGVAPWAGPGSLPLWVPRPELGGLLAHDPAASLAAGLRLRPFADTARDTLGWVRATPGAAVAGLTAAEEDALLDAWRKTRS
ncbi:MAG: epimerase [Propionicimonas sp.]|nr:epimerase [Propionicimonas sp.]